MRADIAVHRVADVQRDAEIERRFVFAATSPVEDFHVLGREFRRSQRGVANSGHLLVAADPENAQHRIADIFQHLAAMGVDRAGDGLEIIVQDGDQEIERNPVRQAGESAQVAHEQNRPDRRTVAALNVAGVNAPSRFAPEIEIKDAFGHFSARLQLDHHREGRPQRQQTVNIGVRKTALGLGRP